MEKTVVEKARAAEAEARRARTIANPSTMRASAAAEGPVSTLATSNRARLAFLERTRAGVAQAGATGAPAAYDWGTSYVQQLTALHDAGVEHEADRVGRDMLRNAPGGDPLQGGGAQTMLAPAWRAAFEQHLGRDLSALKIRDDESAHDRAGAMSACAFTKGGEIHLGRAARQRAPDAVAQTVAHEVVHVAQQAGVPHNKAAAAALKAARPAVPLREPDVPGTVDISAKWLRTPMKREFVVFTDPTSKRMVVLPAVDAIRYVEIPKEVQEEAQATAAASGAPPSPFTAFATIAKNSLMAVRVNATTMFFVDVGGRPSVVNPGALNAIETALEVNSLLGIAITHAHLDHADSLGEVALRYDIHARNISFPAEFLNIPAFRNLLETLGRDPRFEPLGFADLANFNQIQTQTGAGFYRVERTEGDVDFVYVGLSRPMAQGFSGRPVGQTVRGPGRQGSSAVRAPEVDAGSMMVRVTNRTTGKSELFLSDMRAETRIELAGLMGDTAWNGFVGGVTSLILLSHHMGVASATDLAEHADLIVRSGATRVTVQSQERYGGKQFLNRSQIRALRESGVEVEVLLEPAGAGVGTVTHNTAGGTQQQGGNIEVTSPTARALEVVGRLNTLRRVEQVLTEFGEFAQGPYQQQTAAVRAARTSLEREWQAYREYTMSNANEGSATHGRAELKDEAEQDARAARVGRRDPIEDNFTPGYMEFIGELARLGPYYRTYRAELEASRTSGELSEAGFDAMWEIDPGAAKRLLDSSGLGRGARRKIGKYMPGQDIPVRSRVAAGFLLGIEIFNEIIAPAVMEIQASHLNSRVAPYLEIIQWWKAKGVSPSLQGVNDRWWPRSNEWTHDEDRIFSLLDSEDLDWLTMTDIPETEWDNFTLWASTNLIDYNDFQAHIWMSNAIKNDGDWAFKTSEIHGETFGHSMSTTWKHHRRLTTILDAAYQRVLANTKRTVEGKMAAPDSSQRKTLRGIDDVIGVLHDMPPPTGRFRFCPNQADGTMYVLSKGGYRDRAELRVKGNLLVYTFPPSSIAQYNGDVPDGLVVVGGADLDSYIELRSSPNRTKEQVGTFTSGDPSWGPRNTADNPYEVLLARTSDLEPAP